MKTKTKLKAQEVLLHKAIKALVNSPQIFSVYIKTKAVEVRVERNDKYEVQKQKTIGF